MSRGQRGIAYLGPTDSLADKAEGTVWLLAQPAGAPPSGLPVIAVTPTPTATYYRVIAPPDPNPMPQPAEPTVEDGYVASCTPARHLPRRCSQGRPAHFPSGYSMHSQARRSTSPNPAPLLFCRTPPTAACPGVRQFCSGSKINFVRPGRRRLSECGLLPADGLRSRCGCFPAAQGDHDVTGDLHPSRGLCTSFDS